MAYFAVPKDGIIVNVIIADTKKDADLATDTNCVPYDLTDEIGIGFVFDTLTQKWGPAEPVA